MRRLRLLLTGIAMAVVSLSSTAQEKIDRVIEKLENTDKVTVTYTEKRNPKTKKTYKSSKIITFSDATMAKQLREAMKQESENAIEISQVNKAIKVLKFGDGNMSKKYTLIESGNTWTLTVVKQVLSYYPASELGMINFDDGTLNGLDGLTDRLANIDWSSISMGR